MVMYIGDAKIESKDKSMMSNCISIQLAIIKYMKYPSKALLNNRLKLYNSFSIFQQQINFFMMQMKKFKFKLKLEKI